MGSVDEFAREQAILAALKAGGHVEVQTLAGQFGVSAVTIRKDLNLLEARNLLRRVRGGAVSAGTPDEGAFEMRLRYQVDRKRSIARAAAGLVRDGDVVALDSSTTTYYLAEELINRRGLVVITNGLRHAMLLMERSSALVLIPGGTIRRSASSVVGPIGDVLAGRGRIRVGFFGVAGLSTSMGLLDISAEEAQTKRFMARACARVYAVFDSGKVDGFGLHAFAEPGGITGLLTDGNVDDDFVDGWQAIGVRVTTTPVTDDGAGTDQEVNVKPQRRTRNGTSMADAR